MKLRLGYIVLLALILTGCLVCRHVALAHYGWAVENGYAPKFVLYTTTLETRIMSGGIWNGHVQVRVEKDGKAQWVYGDPPSLRDEPEAPLGEHCWIMDMPEYLKWMQEYKHLSQIPLPPASYREKHWPECRT